MSDVSPVPTPRTEASWIDSTGTLIVRIPRPGTYVIADDGTVREAAAAPLEPRCEVRPTGQEWRESCGRPMPCPVHAAPLEPPRPPRDPAREFAYWFEEQPLQRQHDFIAVWLKQHPDMGLSGTAQPPEAALRVEYNTGRSHGYAEGLREGTAQPLDVPTLGLWIHYTRHGNEDPDFDMGNAMNRARAVLQGIESRRLGAASDQRRELPEAEPQAEPWTSEEAERQFQLRKEEEDRL